MRHHKLFSYSPKAVRDRLNAAVDLADDILQQEKILVEQLYEIDQHRLYVRYGYKSLTGFCNHALRFSKTQTQRLVTQVRRYEPTSNIRPEGELTPVCV